MENITTIEKITLFLSVMSFIMCLILFYKRHKDELNKRPAIGGIPFDDSDYSNYSEQLVGEEVAKPTATPYYITVKNNTNEIKKCRLFGLGDFLFSKNFGSDEGVQVDMGTTSVNYLFMLLQSAFNPFETSLMSFKSKNLKQLGERITITSKDATGQLCQIPLITSNYIRPDGVGISIDEEGKELTEKDLKNVDVHYTLRVDMNTNLELDILPNTELFILVYPSMKFTHFNSFNLGNIFKKYSSPKTKTN